MTYLFLLAGVAGHVMLVIFNGTLAGILIARTMGHNSTS
jgi:hypothetical protein